MALRNAQPATFRPKGLSDTVDGGNAFPGAMASLANLIPSPSTDMAFVPRPAAASQTTFGSFTTPGAVSGLLVVGNIAYGMIASGRNAGNDEPFAFNLSTSTFLTVNGITSANTPTTPSTSGDWTPPILAVVASRIIVCHPGFAGGTTKFGFFDISGFSSSTLTGTTHIGTKTIDTISSSALTAGWQVGMTITDAHGDIPANTTIVSINSAGTTVTITNACTAGHASNTLTVAGGSATTPLWGAGDTQPTNLTAVPVAVAQMAGRAYYAVGATLQYSDSGAACNITNVGGLVQTISFQNGINVTALGALPLSSPFLGGIVQSIIAFQSNFALQQITGDASVTSGGPSAGQLTSNLLRAGTGTLSPLSIVNFNDGLGFISPEGFRYIDFFAKVSGPVGDHGTGVTVPFIYALNPSRTCAAANSDVIRFSVKNGNAAGTPVQEYWLDLTRKVWTGPHSFPAAIIQPWGATFLMVPSGVTAALFSSDSAPGSASSYTENGTSLSWTFKTSLIPDNNQAVMNRMVRTALACELPPQALLTIIVMDEAGNNLDSVTLAGSGQAQTTWGSFTWGGAPWFGGAGIYQQRRLSWHVPIVFKQCTIQITGNSLGGLILANIYADLQKIGYFIESTA